MSDTNDTAEEIPAWVHYGKLIDDEGTPPTYVWTETWYGHELRIAIDPTLISYTNPMQAGFDPNVAWHTPKYVHYTHGQSHIWFKWAFSVDGLELYNERNMALGLPLMSITSYPQYFSDLIPEELLELALENAIGAITIRPGDTDREFFKGYTRSMMAWCTSHDAEQLIGYEEDLQRLKEAREDQSQGEGETL